MAKSKRKSGSSTDISRWETELTQAPFCEDEWKACVLFAVPQQAEDFPHLKIMADTIGTGLRKLYSIIDNEILIKEVKDLAHGKGKGKAPTTKPPQFIEIADAIKAHADQGEELSASLLSKLLKFKLLMIKQKDLERREEEKKAMEAAARQAKKDERAHSKIHSSPGKRSKSQSPGKKKRGKDEAPQSPKKDTKLKRRGEVEDTFKTVDDEPDGPDDPKHYIIIHGVYDATVLQPLIDLGISINGIVQVQSESQNLERKLSEANSSESQEQISHQDGSQEDEKIVSEEDDIEMMKFKEKLARFWTETEKIIFKAPSGNKVKDIAKSVVIIEDGWISGGGLLDLEQEKKTEFGAKLFDKVADVCYDLLDHQRHYKRYMDNLKLVHIPPLKINAVTPVPGVVSSMSMTDNVAVTVQLTKPEKVDTDTRYYNHLMDFIPCESQSVPLILHCMLEQVIASTGGCNPMDDTPTPREDGLHDLLGKYFDDKLSMLGFTLQKDSKIASKLSQTQNFYPTIIYYGDEETKRFYHLAKMNQIDPKQIEDNILKLHPYSLMANISPQSNEDRVEVATRKQQLTHFCFKDGYSEGINRIDRILQQLSFESVTLKQMNESGEILIPEDDSSNQHLGWDDPFMDTKLLQKLDLSKTDLDATDMNDLKSLRNLEDYSYAEYFEPSVLVQVLDQVSTLYPFIDVYYHKGIGSLLTIFHNPQNSDYQNNVEWDTWLHSNVGFRNYMEYVSDAIDDWQRGEERIAEELANKPVTPQTPPPEPSPEPLKSGSRHNLMTRAELTEVKASEDDKNKKKGHKPRSRSGSPHKREVTRIGKTPDKREKPGSGKRRTPSARLSRSRTGTASVKNAKGRATHDKKLDDEEPSQEQVEVLENEYPFTGYDIGDNLIHVSGNRSYLFPKDGGLIKIEKTTYVHGNVSVMASVYRDDNYLVMHFINPTQPKSDVEGLDVSPSKPPIVQIEEVNEEDFSTPEEEQGECNIKDLFNCLPPIPELSEPLSDYSSFYGQLKDGMGIGMNSSVTKDIQEKCQNLEAAFNQLKKEILEKPSALYSTSSNTHAKAGSPKGRKKHDDDSKKHEELEKQVEAEKREKIEEMALEIQGLRRLNNGRNNLYVTCPDGLHVCFRHTEEIKENETVSRLIVRQEYPMRTNGIHPCEKERLKPAMEEKIRCITDDGIVLKYMIDNSLEVLRPDGCIIRSPSYTTKRQSQPAHDLSGTGNNLNVNASHNTSRKKPGGSQSRKMSSLDIAPEPEEQYQPPNPEWTIINRDGNQYHRASDGEEKILMNLLLSHATCPKTSQVVETREDGLINIYRPDETEIIEHCDGTRITNFFQCIRNKCDGETGEETGTGSDPVRFIKIECIGYSTVIINTSTREMEVIFGNGTTINAFPAGGYDIRCTDSSRLCINSKGEVAFIPRGNTANGLTVDTDCLSNDCDLLPEGIYALRHAANDCLFLKDLNGNKFELTSNGDATVTKGKINAENKDSVLARYFVIYKDGSGKELLRHRNIAKYLDDAERDPSVAVLISNDEDPDIKGITVLKPHQEYTGQIWLKEKDEDNIIPTELTERDFSTLPSYESTLPSHERKIAGPVFGSNAGIGFQVATKPLPKPPKQPTMCPSVLEMRHIIKHKPLDNEMRQVMHDGIKAYRNFMIKGIVVKEGLLPVDPRDEDEKEKASQLLQKFHQMQITENSKDPEMKEESEIEDSIAKAYVDAVMPPPSPPPVKAQPKRSKWEWERDKIEIAELKYAQQDLRTKAVPLYFDTEEGQAFLNAINEVPDMERVAANLAKETSFPAKRPDSIASSVSENIGASAISIGTPQPQEQRSSDSSYSEINAVDIIGFPAAMKDSALHLRPYNPTPSQAVTGQKITDSQNPSRPFNPTPSLAAKGALLYIDSESSGVGLPLQKLVEEDHSKMPMLINELLDESVEEEDYYKDSPDKLKSLDYDVTGNRRRHEVDIPRSILGARPGALPNSKFATTEEPVRRQVKTASVAGAVKPNLTANMRGFKLVPHYVDFGVLKEGLTYSHSVALRNVGVDICRFKVKQPPPSTGLRIWYKPGPVAAGMSTILDIEILAIAVGVEGSSGIGSVRYHIEITTETDILYLPVAATILTEHEYENRTQASPKGGPSLNTVMLGQRPSSREALTRPKKD